MMRSGPPAGTSDYDIAMRSERDAFVRDCPYYFLVGAPTLQPAAGRTGVYEIVTAVNEEPNADEDTNIDDEGTHTGLRQLKDGDTLPQLYAVKKVQTMFESMVTIGRTPNNDIVLADVQISRFHAFLRVHPDRVELGDAGSRNGTFVNDQRLIPKGQVVIVIPGDVIKFGTIQLEFLDAGGAWDRVRSLGA
jgi:hypothetical protein